MKKFIVIGITAIMLAMPMSVSASVGFVPSGLNKAKIVMNLSKTNISSADLAKIIEMLKSK